MSLHNTINDRDGNLQQEGDEAAAPKGKQQPATRILHALIEGGEQDVAKIASFIRKHPEAKAEMYALLHKTLGNRFVDSVESFFEMDDKSDPAKADAAGPQKMNAQNFTIAPPSDGDQVVKEGLAAQDGPQKMNAQNFTIAPPSDGDQVVKEGLAAQDTAEQGKPRDQNLRNEAMRDFAAINGEPNRGIQPSAKDQAEATAEVRDDKPKVSEQKTEIASSSQVQPQQKVDERELMDPYAESKEAESEEGGADAGAKSANGPMKVTASVLRVRTSPTSASKTNIIGKLQRGAVIQAVGTRGDWVQIEYKGQTAFVHGKYVTPSEPAAETAQAAPANDKPAIV